VTTRPVTRHPLARFDRECFWSLKQPEALTIPPIQGKCSVSFAPEVRALADAAIDCCWTSIRPTEVQEVLVVQMSVIGLALAAEPSAGSPKALSRVLSTV
jgi:hypothetical protein